MAWNSLNFDLVGSELALFFTYMCDIIDAVTVGCCVFWCRWLSVNKVRGARFVFSTYVPKHCSCLVSPTIPSYHATTFKSQCGLTF